MNQNRNTLLFVVLSMALLGGYYVLAGRFAPPPAPAKVQAPPPESSTSQAQPAAPVEAVSTPVQAAPSKTPAPFQMTDVVSLENEALRLTWRKLDGTLVQAVWKADQTPFFPEMDKALGTEPFPGLGGAIETYFDQEPQIRSLEGAQEIRFTNTLGDVLTYQVPQRGDALHISWTTRRGAHLFLLRKPQDEKGAARLGRVFTIEEKGIQSAAMMDLVKDPFLSFLGAKRKELPFETTRIGLDAGIEARKDQTNHYFAAIWETSRMPQRDQHSRYAGFHVAPGQDGSVQARLYLGPKEAKHLKAFGAPYIQALDFGFFGLISKFLFWVIGTIQVAVPNWGWAIVVFSILLRLALWPLNTKTITSMLRMKDLEPHQKALQAKYEKFGSDMTKKAEMQKELMAFYKKNGYNPMGGCLPMLLQMPVFFALWSALSAVFELRHAPFAGTWIKDLSAGDPLYILPVLLGASMVAQSAMTPAAGDPTQRKMMMWLMPIMMTFFFASTPAGLCIYYLTFSLVHMAQSWWIMRNYKPQPVVL